MIEIELSLYFQIGNTNLAASDVTVNENTAQHSHSLEKLYSLTGYGDDRDSGHTTELVKSIHALYGPIAAFVGADCADKLYIKQTDNNVEPRSDKR